MISPSDTLGPYFDNEGEVLALGALNFLDPDTVSNKSVYLDQDLTTPASNPVILNSSGKLSNQIFYGVGDYLVRSYSLIDPDQVSPVFPDDYALVEQWIDKGLDATTSASNTSLWTVETIAELSDVDPNEHNVVQVIGYYDKEDDIDNRVYYWDSISVQAADGGAFIGSNVLGSGRWKLKCPSDDVDVRWFGAIPGSGLDCNGAINSAVAFAVSSRLVKDTSIYFPKGTYQVTAGTINASCGVKMAQGVNFYNTNASDFILSLESYFNIFKEEKINNNSSTGNSIISFLNSSYGRNNDLVINPRWYNDTDECLRYANGNPVLINRDENFVLTESVTTRLKFRGTGKLTFTAGLGIVLTVASVDDENVNNIRFDTGANPTNKHFEFTGGVEVYSRWFAKNDDLKYCGAINNSLIVNNTITLATGYVLDLTKFTIIKGDKGSLVLDTNTSISVPGNLIGRIFKFNDASASLIINNGGLYSSNNFFLNTNESIEGLIRSANTNGSVATFNNEVLDSVIDITSTGLSEIEIHNLRIVSPGSFAVDTKLILKESSLNCSMALTGADIYLYDSKLTPTNSITLDVLEAYNSEVEGTVSVLTRFKAFDSYLYGQITSTNTEVKLCSVFAELIPTPAGGEWSFIISDNVFNGGYIKPNGSASSLRAIIERNDFRFPGSEDPNTFLYIPIQDTNFVVPTVSYVSSNPYYTGAKVAYNVRVSDNTPFINFKFSTAPTNGTLVKQTKFEIRDAEYGITSIGIKNALGSEVVLCPAVADKLVYNNAQATSMVDTAGTDAARISPAGYVSEINPTEFVLQFENDGSVTEQGASVLIDLYPFKRN